MLLSNVDFSNEFQWAKIVCPIFAFFIAYVIALAQLITEDTRYLRTVSLFLFKSINLHFYGVLYGIFAFLITLLSDYFIEQEILLAQSNYFVRAMLIGLFIKSFLKVSFFNLQLTPNSQPVPLGPELIVRIFEPELLYSIGIDRDIAIKSFLSPYIKNYTDSLQVERLISDNIPRSIPADERKVLIVDDLETRKNNIYDMMEWFLSQFGVKYFKIVFVLP